MDILPKTDQACDCAEGKVGDMPTGLHRHDCEYIAHRNSLIPAAEAFADSKAPDDRGGRRWSGFFNHKMAELLKQNGRRAEP